MALTAHDKTIVRRTARELRDAYDRGEDDSLSETVMLSDGYADVHIYPEDSTGSYVIRGRTSTRVPTRVGPSRSGAKHKAGRKTSARKRVPSKRVANPDDIDAKTKFTLRRETLNSGGYDRYGEYFGRGAPLFVYEGEVPTSSRDVYGDTRRSQRDVRGHVRAADRQEAMAKIRQKYPMARFFGEKSKVANPAVSPARVEGTPALGNALLEWRDFSVIQKVGESFAAGRPVPVTLARAVLTKLRRMDASKIGGAANAAHLRNIIRRLAARVAVAARKRKPAAKRAPSRRKAH